MKISRVNLFGKHFIQIDGADGLPDGIECYPIDLIVSIIGNDRPDSRTFELAFAGGYSRTYKGADAAAAWEFMRSLEKVSA